MEKWCEFNHAPQQVNNYWIVKKFYPEQVSPHTEASSYTFWPYSASEWESQGSAGPHPCDRGFWEALDPCVSWLILDLAALPEAIRLKDI